MTKIKIYKGEINCHFKGLGWNTINFRQARRKRLCKREKTRPVNEIFLGHEIKSNYIKQILSIEVRS